MLKSPITLIMRAQYPGLDNLKMVDLDLQAPMSIRLASGREILCDDERALYYWVEGLNDGIIGSNSASLVLLSHCLGEIADSNNMNFSKTCKEGKRIGGEGNWAVVNGIVSKYIR